MKHKWHKEIQAWADGKAIEVRDIRSDWLVVPNPQWLEDGDIEYRIKPQPKEPKYLYVYQHETKGLSLGFAPHAALNMWKTKIVGKIPLEHDDD